ncbi:MAG TPA: hypothetical protein VGX91_15285 [Candidatus Cybelea sp.]|jgi:hypothetical protein|nr:hypothetical protein [Candidatus Cybelea sp.]
MKNLVPIILAVSALLVGGGRAAAPSVLPAALPADRARELPQAAEPDVRPATDANLYVPNFFQNIVTVYKAGSDTLIQTISAGMNGLNQGFPISTDAAVTIYRADSSRQLLRTITKGLAYPVALVLDRFNNLYVSNDRYGYGSVLFYEPGKSTASRIITEGIQVPQGLLSILPGSCM